VFICRICHEKDLPVTKCSTGDFIFTHTPTVFAPCSICGKTRLLTFCHKYPAAVGGVKRLDQQESTSNQSRVLPD